jgi:hypothetical protein
LPSVVIVIAITVITFAAVVPATFLLLATVGTAAGLDPLLRIVAQCLILVTGETGPAPRIQPHLLT